MNETATARPVRLADATSLAVTTAIGSATPLPGQIRARLEACFRTDLSALRLAVDPAPAAIGAAGLAYGSAIVIHPAWFAPDTAAGLRLLGHEAAHALQQRGCRPSAGGLRLLRDSALETEADQAADALLAGGVWRGAAAAGWRGDMFVQPQATGNLDTAYLDGGTMNPAGGAITFAANNSMNEVWSTRAQAFLRAKTLLGIPASVAKRTYHFWLLGGGMVLGEGTDIAGNGNAPMIGAAAGQRTGRYYDFGKGRLIVEHPDDPNSTTAMGAGAAVQRGHFHCCQYDVGSGCTQAMYMLYATNLGFSQVAGGPAVYDWDRRFTFETAAGGVTGHHIYYH